MFLSNWGYVAQRARLIVGIIPLVAIATPAAVAEERQSLSLSAASSETASSETASSETASSDTAATAAARGEARIREALQRQVALDFNETPLADVVEQLKKDLQIEIQIDTKALDNSGIASDVPLTQSIKGITLNSALRLLLGSVDLTFMIDSEILVITTPDRAGAQLKSEIYAVEDLVRYAAVAGEPETDYDPLIAVVKTTLAPVSWDEVGGPGSLSAIQGKLVVTQTPDVQDDIQSLLDALRRARDGQKQLGTAAIPVERDADPQAEEAIRQALDKPIDLDFSETPLADAISQISTKLGIQILLDHKGLEEASIAADVPVTRTMSGVSGRSALKMIFHALDLTYDVHGGVLRVTTPDRCGSVLRKSVYPVGDLIEIGQEETGGDKETAGDNLIDMIVSSVAQQSWDEVGGPGDIVQFIAADAIVISQTQAVHDEVAELFAKLRRVHQQAAERGQPAAVLPRAQLKTKFYSVASDGNADKRIEQLVKWIPESIAPKRWKEGEAFVKPAPDGILVRQTSAVHRQIQMVLDQMQQPAKPGGGGGWGGGFF